MEHVMPYSLASAVTTEVANWSTPLDGNVKLYTYIIEIIIDKSWSKCLQDKQSLEEMGWFNILRLEFRTDPN